MARPVQSGDDAVQNLGDGGFVGVNMRLDPDKVPAGYMSGAVNARFRAGVAEPRLGMTILPWLNKIQNHQVLPWGTVHGVGVFADPARFIEHIIIAADGLVYRVQSNSGPIAVPLPDGVTITGPVTFVQCFDVLIMFRGFDLAPLAMSQVESGFASILQTEEGEESGTEPIPNSDHGLFFQNRLLIPNDNDEVAISDVLDYTRYEPIHNEVRINQGSADRLVAIHKFSETAVVAFKEHSIYIVNHVYGDLDALQQDVLTQEFGLAARRSVAQVGRDLWFLSELGVMAIAQTDDGKVQVTNRPVSEPIEPLIKRINWRYASAAVAAYHDNRYYLAVPLDDAVRLGPELLTGQIVGVCIPPPPPPAPPSEGANGAVVSVTAGSVYRWTQGSNETGLVNGSETYTGSRDFTAASAQVIIKLPESETVATGSLRALQRGVNNAVLVYDLLNASWSGLDQADDFAVSHFLLAKHNNIRRLFVVSPSGFIFLYEDGYRDQLANSYVDVTVTSWPQTGDTIQVNGGTVVTANRSLGANSASNWAVRDGQSAAAANLFGELGSLGYIAGNWTCPGALAYPISGGVRFLSTNGLLPSVTVTGSWSDVAYHGAADVSMVLTTRGYSGGPFAHYPWISLFLQAWFAQYTVELITEGVSEDKVVASRTLRRNKWLRPFNRADYDQTNALGDAADPYREDYSIALGPLSAQQLHLLSQGQRVDLHQQITESFRVKPRGRLVQLRVNNSRGRLRLAGIELLTRQLPTRAGRLS